MSERPAQSQPYPGESGEMTPEPRDEMRDYTGRGLLEGKRALVTGGDSGIGRAVAIGLAKEGADVAITYLKEDTDARRTKELVEKEGRRCLTLHGDMAEERHTREAVRRVAEEFGRIDVLILHHGTQKPVEDVREITTEQLERTFRVNVLSLFWTVQEALDHMPDGGSIVVTGSINGLRGNKSLIDYSASKAAAMNFAPVHGAGAARPGHPRQLRGAGPGMDAAHPGDVRRGAGGELRRAVADGPGGRARRDRPVVRLLRQQPALLLLHRAEPRARRRRGPPGLTE